MALDKTDLTAIEQIIDKALKPVKADISVMKSEIKIIHEKLDKIEKWLPLENTYIISSLKKRTKSTS